MTPPERQALPVIVPLARLLQAHGDSGGAALLLSQLLDSLDAEAAPFDWVLLEAAVLYSDITGDQRWADYAARARLRLHPPRHSLDQPAAVGPPPRPRRPHNDSGVPAPGACMRLLHNAQTLHAQGRCGEAVRAAARALDIWRRSDGADGGATLLVWLTAMLCACRRDHDAEAQLRTDVRLLPPVGSPEREAFAGYGIRTFTLLATTHDTTCARRQLPPSLAGLTAPAAAAGPWPERRNRWWQLLLTLTDTP